MELELYYSLATKSKRAIQRKYTRHGKVYSYRPRGDLLKRLAEKFGLTTEQVQDQLSREREYLLTYLVK